MAEGLNQVMLLGNLGQDPELRTTQTGNAVLKLRMATSKSYLDANRVRQERTEWHSVVVWGRRAEALAKILARGSKLFVQGELRTSQYDDREGNTRYRTEIVANNIVLCGGGSRRPGSPSADPGDEFSRGEDEPPYGGDDDIPF